MGLGGRMVATRMMKRDEDEQHDFGGVRWG